MNDMKPSCKAELFEMICEVWNKLDIKILQDLIESMPRRIAAVLKNNGYPTRY